MKVYNVPQASPVGKLIDLIEFDCKSAGYVLSRYQTSIGKYRHVVTYIVHQGERQPKTLQNQGILTYCLIPMLEGHTEKCTAYGHLLKLAMEVQEFVKGKK